MDEEQEQDSKRSSSALLIWLVAVPLLYVLSIGPVGTIAVESHLISLNLVQTFYAPVIWLRNNTPMRGPLDWYGHLWGLH